MTEFRVGEIKVTRLIESESPFLPISDMLPDATPQAIDPYRQWLEPAALCSQTSRMILPVQSYLVQTRHHLVLIDTCVGNHKSCGFFKPWHRMQGDSWPNAFQRTGFRPRDVDFVLCTHLHLDHCGWNTELVNGIWHPTFENARYLFDRTEYDHIASKGGATFEQNIVPVMAAGRGVLVDGGYAIDDQVWLESTPGHTPGHVAIHLRSAGSRAIMIGDIMHSPVQCEEPDWRCIADEDFSRARLTRHRILEQYCETDMLILTAHFPSPSIGFVVAGDCQYRFRYR